MAPETKHRTLPDLSKLKLGDTKSRPVPAAKKVEEVADSWEDESDDDDVTGGVSLDIAKSPSSQEKRDEESQEESDTESKDPTLEDTSFLAGTSSFYSSGGKEAVSSSTPRQRPATSMAVVNRLIASGTGHRIRRTEEQRNADKEKFEKEKQKREDERRAREEAERAKKAVWEDD